MSARTPPENGSQKMGGALALARTLVLCQKMVPMKWCVFSRQPALCQKTVPWNLLYFCCQRALCQKMAPRKMGGALVPARALPENGSQKMVRFYVSACSSPKTGCLKNVLCLVSARTPCQEMVPRERRYFCVSARSAMKWLPENGSQETVFFVCQPALCQKTVS